MTWRPEPASCASDVGAFEHHQHLTGLNVLAFLDLEGGDAAALLALHGLAVAGHGDPALGVGRGVQPREQRPAEDQAEEDEDDQPAVLELAGRLVVDRPMCSIRLRRVAGRSC